MTTTTEGERPMITGSWAVRFTMDGRRHTAAGMTEDDAKATAKDYAASAPGTSPEAVDLVAELEAAFPVFTRVRWNGQWKTTGMVTAETGSPLSNSPPEVPVCCAVDHHGDGIVCVRIDGHDHPIWVRADYIHAYTKKDDLA